MKPFVLDQACLFIREQTQVVTQMLSKQHHRVIEQFIEFKDRTEAKLNRAINLEKTIAHLERLVALKTPVMEAEYAIDERSALSLYDCLVPALKEHRRFKVQAN